MDAGHVAEEKLVEKKFLDDVYHLILHVEGKFPSGTADCNES